MTKHYFITISSLITTFSRIESGKEFEFSISTENTNLATKFINSGDKIIATINENIYYNFVVIEVSNDLLKLKKTFEVEKSIDNFNSTIGSFELISKEDYDSICSKLFSDYFHSDLSSVLADNDNELELKEMFADWLFIQRKYTRVYKDSKAILIQKLSEFETAYESDFGLRVFDNKSFSLETIIGELETNVIDDSGSIGEINKNTVGNGSVKAILGSNNYIKFLKDLLARQKNEPTDSRGSTELSATDEKPIQIDFNYKSFHQKTKEAGLIFSEKMVARFIASLCTKPFVICSGLSGSGKTKLAQAFATWICESDNQYKLIPVGADWTNREPLLGYPNGLDSKNYVKPDVGTLDIIFSALEPENEKKPYFLILDEMNLSHVERYFADFLSIMESKGKIKLHSSDTIIGVEKEFSWPKNLFIIGTVNIDETTYMFSPKVLDRANVIEFRVSENDLEKYLDSDIKLVMDKFMNATKTSGLGANMGEEFYLLAKSETRNTIASKTVLLNFFNELQKAGSEFGYRSAFEINRIIAILNEISKDDKSWDEKVIEDDEFIDIAIMQKLLPKLHGSRSKLTKVLPILGGFCVNESKKEKIKELYFDKVDDIDFQSDSDIIFKISFEKICRMYKNAVENGYASYAEA